MNIPYQTGRSLYQIKLFPVGPHRDFFFEAGAYGFDKPAFGFSGIGGRLYDDLGLFFGSYSNKEIDIDVSYVGQNGSPCATITRCNGQIFTNRQRNDEATVRLRSESPITVFDSSSADSISYEVKTFGARKDFDGGVVYYMTTGSQNDDLLIDFFSGNLAGANLTVQKFEVSSGADVTGISGAVAIIMGADMNLSNCADTYTELNVDIPVLFLDASAALDSAAGLLPTLSYDPITISYKMVSGISSSYSNRDTPAGNLAFFGRYPILYPFSGVPYNNSTTRSRDVYGIDSSPPYGRNELIYVNTAPSITSAPAIVTFTGGEDCYLGVTEAKRAVVNFGEVEFSGLSDDGKHIILNAFAWIMDTGLAFEYQDGPPPDLGGDDLGDHEATQDLEMASYSIFGAEGVFGTFSGNGDAIECSHSGTGVLNGYDGTMLDIAEKFDGEARTQSTINSYIPSVFGYMQMSQISTSGSIGWIPERNNTAGYMYTCGGYESASSTMQSGQAYIEVDVPALTTGMDTGASVNVAIVGSSTSIAECYLNVDLYSVSQVGAATKIFTLTGQTVSSTNVPQIVSMTPTGVFSGERLTIEFTFFSKSSKSIKILGGEARFV